MAGDLRGRAVRGAWHLTIGNLAESAGGYVYWVLVSALASPAEVGVASAVAGVGALLGALLILGLNQSVQKYLPECVASGDQACASRTLSSSVLAAAPIYAGAGLLLLAYGALMGGEKFNLAMAAWSLLLVVTWGWSLLARSAIIALLETGLDLAVTIAGTVLRLAVGVGLTLAGYGWAGIVAGLATPLVLRSVVYTWVLASQLGLARPETRLARSLVLSGLSVWLPNALHTAGWWLGVVTVYGLREAPDAGLYYIATMVASVVNSIAAAVSSIILPALSHVPEEERPGLASQAIVATYLATAPVTGVLLLFPEPILGLIGEEYIAASGPLRVIAAGLLAQPAAVLAMQYMFSRSRQRRVLGIGLSMNIPRLILYPPLARAHGGIGAAASLSVGSYLGLGAALVLAPELLRGVTRGIVVAAASVVAELLVLVMAGGGLWQAIIAVAAGYMAAPVLGLVTSRELEMLLSPVVGRRLARAVSRIAWRR